MVGDQFYTRTPPGLQTNHAVADATTNVPGKRTYRTVVSKRDASETCLNLSDASGVAQTYCSCVVN